MPAERMGEMKNDTLPIWKEGSEWVHWKDRVFPLVTFYQIHAVSAQLLTFLELYPVKASCRMASYMKEEGDRLVRLLPGVSGESLERAFYAAIAVKCYLLEGKENDRAQAMDHLKAIRRLLHLDEFFQKWQSPLERTLCPEEAKEPLQAVPLR